MVTMKMVFAGGVLALVLGLAGCGGGATATAPPAVATSAPTGTPAAVRPSTATSATAATTPTAPGTATRAASPATPTAATPLPGATATRAGTASATPGRLPTATDVGIKTVSLGVGQSAILPEEGLTLDFTDVLNDSRCPRSANGTTVTCAWAGEATVVIVAGRGGVTSRLTLVMPGLTDNAAQGPDRPKTYTTFEGYKIQVMSLEPQPSVDDSKPGGYRVTLLVSKVG